MTMPDPRTAPPPLLRRRISRIAAPFLLVAALCVAWATPVSAEEEGASVFGWIVSSEGGPVVGASVTLWTEEDEVAGGPVTTDDTGMFQVDGVPVGTYLVVVEADGFLTSTASHEVGSATGFSEHVHPALEPEGDPEPDGISVFVEDTTFSRAAAGVSVELAPAAGAATVLVTDGNGAVTFSDVEPGTYTLTALAGPHHEASDSEEIVYDGGSYYTDLEISTILSCEPTAAQTGLTNMGFESGMSGWTIGYETETISVVGTDTVSESLTVSPWSGVQMARLGHPQASSDVEQPLGPNVLCQDFVVDAATEAFAFNVFTYDYTGFDEFHFDLVVTDPETGETLAQYEQGAWGSGTALKTTGWRGAQLDLGSHLGETVRLTFRAGGTSDELFPFWVYLDSAETLPPTVVVDPADVEVATGSVMTDPTTGQVTVAMPTGDVSAVTMSFPGDCVNPETTPTATVLLNGTGFPAIDNSDGTFTATIPAESVESGTLTAQVMCAGEPTVTTQIGEIVLYDPSGYVTDATTDEPVVGAEVRLHKVPGWTPRAAEGPHPATSCETNESKAEGAPWTQAAPTELGQLVNSASPEISPNVNPFLTNVDGYYGWDVAEGCWYVTVEADGYEPLTSPVVGVPSEVTDLDLQLDPVGQPPVVTLDGPTSVVESLSAEFTVEVDDAEATLQYRVDAGPWTSVVDGGFTVAGGLSIGSHTVTVRAVGGHGEGTDSAPLTVRARSFPDVVPGFLFFGDIEWLVENEITTGYADGTYKPANSVNRGSMAAFLYRISGQPEFTPPTVATFPDVPTNHRFFKEIEWLVEEEITKGYEDGLYRPDNSVNRGSMAAFLYRTAGSPSFTAPTTATFADVPKGHLFDDEVEWLVEQEITKGYDDGLYRPGNTVNRGSMAAFLHRLDTWIDSRAGVQ